MSKLERRKYRFFYHYNKMNKKMTIHFKKKCNIVKNIVCRVECQTDWRNRQPQLVMKGWAYDIIINKENAIII